MLVTLRVVLILAIIIYFIILLQLLKLKKLNLKYTLLWFFTGIIMIVFALFPKALNMFKFIGIIEPMNGLFAVICFCIIMILMSITSIVSNLKENNKRLVQTTALLEKRIRELENSRESKAD